MELYSLCSQFIGDINITQNFILPHFLKTTHFPQICGKFTPRAFMSHKRLCTSYFNATFRLKYGNFLSQKLGYANEAC